MGQWNREVLEKIKKLCLDRDAEDPKAFYPCQDILGLVFLRFICAAAEFNSKDAPVPPAQAAGGDGRREFQAGERGSDPENERRDRDPEVFIVPDSAAWDRIFPGGKKNGEGGPEPAAKGADQNLIPVIARAIRAIERENPALRDLFPRVLTRTAGRRSSESPGPDAPFLPELGCLLGGLSAPEAGQVFTELMAEFETRAAPLLVRGVRPRTAPVPRGIANLLALMLEPYRGRFYDPCCGAANLPAGAADFVSSRRGKLQELSFYAQEQEAEAWRLARMNLLVRGIDASEIRLNADGPLQKDPHRDIKFDFIAACPPPGEDSYLWIRYTLDRLSAGGLGALILPRSSLASPRAGDREIRRSLVEGRLLDCVVNLPAPIFSGHSPSPCIWFFSRAKISRGRRGDEVLFIDARNLGRPVNRRQREFSAEDINRIARTYHNWRFPKTVPYRDLRSFALSAHIAQIRAAAYSLNPAFYLGIPEEEEETNRGAQFEALRAEFEALVREESRLSRQTAEALRKIRGGDLG